MRKCLVNNRTSLFFDLAVEVVKSFLVAKNYSRSRNDLCAILSTNKKRQTGGRGQSSRRSLSYGAQDLRVCIQEHQRRHPIIAPHELHKKHKRDWHHLCCARPSHRTCSCLLYTSPSPRDGLLSR